MLSIAECTTKLNEKGTVTIRLEPEAGDVVLWGAFLLLVVQNWR